MTAAPMPWTERSEVPLERITDVIMFKKAGQFLNLNAPSIRHDASDLRGPKSGVVDTLDYFMYLKKILNPYNN